MLVKAIPTKYRGVQFRSRLEAKWAAFFDCMGWRWQYEPFDLDGWIPDFKIWGYRGALLVEVKPIDEFDKAVGDKIIKAAIASEVGHELLLLGLGPQPTPIDSYQHDTSRIGWLAEAQDIQHSDGYEYWFGEACIGFETGVQASFEFPDIGHDQGSFHGRLFGNYDGNPLTMPNRTINQAWTEASNRVQWKGVGPVEHSMLDELRQTITQLKVSENKSLDELSLLAGMQRMIEWRVQLASA